MSFLKRKKKRYFLDDTTSKLEQVGIFGIHDDQLDKRIGAIQQLHDKLVSEFQSNDPIKQVAELYNRLSKLDLTLRESGMPWTEQKDALRAWERLVSYAKEGINIMKASITTEEEAIGKKKNGDGNEKIMMERLTFDKTEIVDMLRSFLEVEVFPYGLMIIDHSYRDKHVSPSFNVVVQQQAVPGFGYGGVAPTSAGRTSEETFVELPPQKTYPPEMSIEVKEKKEKEEE